MKHTKKFGFTIIETMLFLGISGLLVMGILIGAGNSINVQRYHDSIMSLQSVLQQQYSDVANVSNDNSGSLACYGDGSIKYRGQSNCVVLGKYITTINSQTLSIKSVIGYIPDDISFLGLNDVDALQLCAVKISPVPGETYEIEWGSSIVKPETRDDLAFSMLVLHSPSSDTVRTFIDPSNVIADADVGTLVTESALLQPVKICVESNGLFSNDKSAILITANSTSSSGIETLGEELSGC